MRLLIEELSVSSDFVVSDHIANRHMWGIDGKPSLDKEQMLQAVDDLIAAAKESDEKYPVYSKLIYGRL